MDSVLIRYHEIALKKGNRAYFTELLKRNILAAVKDLGAKEIKSLPARLLLTFRNEVDAKLLSQRIATVFGVANFSLVERTERDIDVLRQRIVDALNGHRFASFRIETQRGDKTFPLTSPEINRQIVAAVARPLRVVLYRRMMLRIGEAIARKEKAKALVTGESLGQVASQTLDNMAVIQQAARLPILRPLVGMDKQEIVDQARRIGTFDISAVPDQDCCQLFVPKHPATKARYDEVEADEAKLDLQALLRYGLDNACMEEFSFPPTETMCEANSIE